MEQQFQEIQDAASSPTKDEVSGIFNFKKGRSTRTRTPGTVTVDVSPMSVCCDVLTLQRLPPVNSLQHARERLNPEGSKCLLVFRNQYLQQQEMVRPLPHVSLERERRRACRHLRWTISQTWDTSLVSLIHSPNLVSGSANVIAPSSLSGQKPHKLSIIRTIDSR